MGRTLLPDILLQFPPGSLAIWRKVQVLPRRGHYELKFDYVLAKIIGKDLRQGNRRLQLDVLYIGSNSTGKNVLYIQRKTSVSVENIMKVEQYRRQFAAQKEG